MMALFKEIKKYYVYDEIRKGKSNYRYGYRNKWEGRHVINFRFYSQAYQSHQGILRSELIRSDIHSMRIILALWLRIYHKGSKAVSQEWIDFVQSDSNGVCEKSDSGYILRQRGTCSIIERQDVEFQRKRMKNNFKFFDLSWWKDEVTIS